MPVMASHPPGPQFLGDPDGVRACKHQHAVDNSHPDSDFGVLHIYIARPQPVTRQRLESVHQVLHQGAAVISAFFFPVLPAASGNALDGPVAL